MKKIKIFFYIMSGSIIIFLIYSLLLSFNFDNMFYNSKNNELIILTNKNGVTYFKYSKNETIKSGIAKLENGEISFYFKNKKTLIGIYEYKGKYLEINGKLDNKIYKDVRFSQIKSITEYFKAIM